MRKRGFVAAIRRPLGSGRAAVATVLAALALLPVVSCTLIPPPQQGDADRVGQAVLPMAQAALDAGQVETAKRLYQRLLEVAPGSAAARLGLGRVAMAEREPARAATWFLSAAVNAADPETRHQALLAHGRSALGAGQHKEALRSFARLAEGEQAVSHEMRAWGFNGIGVVRWLEGDPQGAVAAIEQATIRDPDEPAFRSNLAAAVDMLASLDLGVPVDPERPPAQRPDVLPAPIGGRSAPTDAEPLVSAALPTDAEPLVSAALPTAAVGAANGLSAGSPMAPPTPAPSLAAATPAPSGAATDGPVPEALCRWWLFTWPCERPPTDAGPADPDTPAEGAETPGKAAIAALPEDAGVGADAVPRVPPTVEPPATELPATASVADAPAPEPPDRTTGESTGGDLPADLVPVGSDAAPDTLDLEALAQAAEAERPAGVKPRSGAARTTRGDTDAPAGAFLVRSAGDIYVQVGAFGERAAAEALAASMRDIGPHGVGIEQAGSGAPVHRVRIGPVQPEEIDELSDELAARGHGRISSNAGADNADAERPSRRDPLAGLAGDAIVVVEGTDAFVQVGAFASADAAATVARQLRERTAHRVEVTSTSTAKGRSVHRVRIGPVGSDETRAVMDGLGDGSPNDPYQEPAR